MTIESFLEGHVRAFDWLGGVPRECVYDNLRSAVARRERATARGHHWNPRFVAAARPLRLSRARLHAGDAAREGLGRGRGPLSQDRVLAGAALRVAGRARRRLRRLARPGRAAAPPRDRPAHRRRAARARARAAAARCRRSPSTRPGAGPRGSRWTAISSTAAASTAPRRRWSISASSCAGTATGSGSSTAATRVADYARSYEHGHLAAGAADAARAAAGRAADPDRRARGRPAGAERLRRALRMSPRPSRGGRRAAALPARKAQGAARPGAPRADRRARRARRAGPTSSSSRTLLEAEVFARDASGARNRIRHAAFPAHKTLEDFDFTAQPGAEKPLILHLAQLAWTTEHMQRLLLRAARHRQDPPRDRAGDQGLPGRPPRRVRDRPAMGRPPRASPAPQRARRRTQTPRALQPARRRRDRLPARSNARPRTCSSRWSRAATNAARSSSPATAASKPGAKSSATPWSPPRSSTGSSTTPTSSPSKARATASRERGTGPRTQPPRHPANRTLSTHHASQLRRLRRLRYPLRIREEHQQPHRPPAAGTPPAGALFDSRKRCTFRFPLTRPNVTNVPQTATFVTASARSGARSATNLPDTATFVTEPRAPGPNRDRLGPAWPSERRARLGRQPLTRP